jgi:hypothetical protein
MYILEVQELGYSGRVLYVAMALSENVVQCQFTSIVMESHYYITVVYSDIESIAFTLNSGPCLVQDKIAMER